jgi:phosphoglycerate dehydrogenase-like enzyme
MQGKKINMLFCVGPKGPAHNQRLLENIKDSLTKYVQRIEFVKDIDEYNALNDKYDFDVNVVQLGTTCAGPVLKDQTINSKNLRWVHSLSAGIDGYLAVEEFRNSPIPLTNAKGAFSTILGEFIALGVLYHTKHLYRFMNRKSEHKWEPEPVELVSNKSMAVIGYGDIGAACAKIAKNGLGMKVIGVKRNPADCSDLYRSYCDEVVGNDQYERVIRDADFVVGVLPKVHDTVHFFNTESTFSKMKKTAVFMNIGRGPTVKEDDLVSSLQNNTIAGAVLDVFEVEPLNKESPLWDMSNVLLTPHCAQQDMDFMLDCVYQLKDNLENFCEGKTLQNLADKSKGY